MQVKAATLITLFTTIGALGIEGRVDAADHGDSPAAGTSPAADITDTYAWGTTGQPLNLIMNVSATGFSDAVQYVFHIESGTGFGALGNEVLVICEFDAAKKIQCWAGADEYVTGDASNEQGIKSASGMLRVFAGERNDPFFFNIRGFLDVIETVKGAAAGLTFDGAGCPALDAATSGLLVGKLTEDGSGGAAADDFAATKVGSIVVQIDPSIAAPGGNVVAVWTSTHMKQ